jgi:hypothetical protein
VARIIGTTWCGKNTFLGYVPQRVAGWKLATPTVFSNKDDSLWNVGIAIVQRKEFVNFAAGLFAANTRKKCPLSLRYSRTGRGGIKPLL